VPTIELRPAALDDLPAMCALTNRAEQFDGLPVVHTLEDMREGFDVPYIDLAQDSRLAFRDGELAGLVWIWNPPAEGAQQRAHLFGTVDPPHRGQGVGTALLGWSQERATERLRRGPAEQAKFVRVEAWEWLEANRRLFTRLGFRAVRWFEELLRPLESLPPLAIPAGVTFVPWPADRHEELRGVRNGAFADHWGSTPVDAARWEHDLHGHGSRLDLSAAALDDATGDIVALVLNAAFPEDDELTGRREAWIGTIGTAREWRRRGLASSLITWSLAAFADAGFTHAALGVDADNPTGAARLYRALGFETMRRSVTYQIEV
jgi:ribosomal protein S18 acetylase RimI-like enzyme